MTEIESLIEQAERVQRQKAKEAREASPLTWLEIKRQYNWFFPRAAICSGP